MCCGARKVKQGEASQVRLSVQHGVNVRRWLVKTAGRRRFVSARRRLQGALAPSAKSADGRSSSVGLEVARCRHCQRGCREREMCGRSVGGDCSRSLQLCKAVARKERRGRSFSERQAPSLSKPKARPTCDWTRCACLRVLNTHTSTSSTFSSQRLHFRTGFSQHPR